MKYQKKPVVVEAMQYTTSNGPDIRKWSDGKCVESPVLEPSEDNPTGEYMQIRTLEGTMIASLGDYIIRGVEGEFYPCKPGIFAKTYEPVWEEL